MRTLKHFFIIGLTFILMLISSPAYAIYSPTISAAVSQIRDHIVSSQKQNGVGSLMEISTSIVNQYEAKRALGQPAGIPGLAQNARAKIARDAFLQAIREPLDGLMMVFNVLPSKGGGIISNCLRNDLWTLEDLKNIVGQEMVKAYMIGDVIHGDQLTKDYDYLVLQIDLLRRQGNDPDAKVFTTVDENGKVLIDYLATEEYAKAHPEEGGPESDEKKTLRYITMKEYLFGTNQGAYYYSFAFPSDQGCPEGDFEKAFVRVANSAKTLATLSTAQGTADWGSIWEMAKVRAKQRAAQWFAANQISLTLGGGQGGQSRSLIKNNGWDQRVAEFQTQIRILKNLAGPVTAPFSLDIYDRVDGVDLVGSEDACAFYQPETGKYYACTPEQLETFNRCNLTVAEAIEEGWIADQKTAREERRDLKVMRQMWGCERYSSMRSNGSITEVFEAQGKKATEEELRFDSELRTFRYQVEFGDIAESNLDGLSDALVSLENEIKRGVEASGTTEEDRGLPTFEEYMTTMMNRHCPNKNYSKQ